MAAAAMARGSGCGSPGLQKLANELGLDIVVSHLPPGTSKWTKIEHRLLSLISQNWRAQPVSYPVIAELISATTTKPGLTVRSELDASQYPSRIVVSDAEIADLNIKPAEFHGEWNRTISPSHRIPIRQIARLFPDEPFASEPIDRTRCRLVSSDPRIANRAHGPHRHRIAFLAVPWERQRVRSVADRAGGSSAVTEPIRRSEAPLFVQEDPALAR
jgi:Rhodopirellula transposase DDE domain